MKKFLLFLCLCLYPLGAGRAQHPLVLQKLNEWNDAAPAPGAEKLHEQIRITAREVYGANEACASSTIFIDRIHPATADRFVFNTLIRKQMRNAWTLIVRLPGCDAAPVRFMIMQDTDDSLKTIRVNRGISYASDSLISDTLPSAWGAADIVLSRTGDRCESAKRFTLGVIRIESEAEGLGPDMFGSRYVGSWDEIWPIEMCDRTVEVLVNFTADGDGGAYFNVSSDKAVVLP